LRFDSFFALVHHEKARKKLCFVSVFFLFEIVNHGGRRGNTARALAQWRHLVASHEAMDVLHQAMRPALHHRIRMAFKIAGVWRVFFVVIVFILDHNHKLKTMLWL
jgi:hypothetical protein